MHPNPFSSKLRTSPIPSLIDGGADFIFVAAEPVFSVPDAEKGWVISVIGIVGYTFNKRPSYKVGKILVGDTTMLEDARSFMVPGPLAKELSTKIRSGQINVETMWTRISAEMKPFQGAPKK